MSDPIACVSIDVDTTLYSVAAVMRTAYKFTGAFHVAIRRPTDTGEPRVTVALTPKVASHRVDEVAIAGDFLNELLDQRLREILETEFGPVRELIVAQAFSDTNLLDSARDVGDYVTDPLGIGLDGPQVSHAETTRQPRTTPASFGPFAFPHIGQAEERSPSALDGASVEPSKE